MEKLSFSGAGRERLVSAVQYLMSLADIMLPGDDGAAKRDWVIDQINALVDVPILSESAERAILEAIVDTIWELVHRARS